MWLKYTQDQRRDEADSLAQSSTNRWLATTPKTWTAILVNEKSAGVTWQNRRTYEHREETEFQRWLAPNLAEK